jgi:hypothetical protein
MCWIGCSATPQRPALVVLTYITSAPKRTNKIQGRDPQALTSSDTEALTASYLRDNEIPLVYGPRFKQ